MNNLLLKYIKKYIKESVIPYAGQHVNARLQHKLSPNISKDMTSLSDEEVMKVVMQNIDERTCISFVNSYDENIPSFNINPRAAYSTPHGNYAYPLTLENLREIIVSKKVKGATFAIDRPYFLLFKINSPNTLIINKDRTSNYKDILLNRAHNKKTTRYDDLNLERDIDRIIKHFLYFVMTSFEPGPMFKDWTVYNSKVFNGQFPQYCKSLENKLHNLLTKNSSFVDSETHEIGNTLSTFVSNTSLTARLEIPKTIQKKFYNETFKLLKKYLVSLSQTSVNKFYKDEDTDDFHRLYFICWFLSNVGKTSNNKKSNGPILTLLLKSIGIDAIIDQGSSTLHSSEPEQTVLLNFGNINAEDIEFLGTFNNIFKESEIYIEELAAKIYKDEGYKFEIDFFSKNENPIGNIVGSTVYTYLEDLLLSYHHDDVILNRGLSIEGEVLKVRFDLYADFNDDYELTQVQELIKLMLRAILKSPYKDKIGVDLGLSLFDYDAKLDISELLKKLYTMPHFELFIEDFCKSQIRLDDNDGVFDSETRSFLTYDQELINSLRPSYTEIVLNQGCGITIIIKDRFYLDELLVGNGCIFFNISAPIKFDLTGMTLFRSKTMEKRADHEQEKQKIIQKINEKLPKVKVKI